ncbi:hypothetical protein CCM_05176 [Cordyceps militaris CM01]|uniref:Biogenesis of lysosome-related organelles complex 1 subunit 1 n=1 Tax=Cordyceps militaris (strain CM01) TaxID=983644 RepID=G3JI66_CORMM|nr:uncharacterized protein CCM_05176 [Cordyceps militaris CM01]EGX91019.1 hypothetical protein CCM_05176 [Cordyceps militaris CM01]
MSEASGPPTATGTQEQQQNPHRMQPQVAISASGASTTSNSSSRRAAASSATSSAPSASRATPATTPSSARTTTLAHHPHHPPLPPHAVGLPPPPSPLLETLPSAETQRHIAEARAAVVASMGNMLDTALQGRAAMLHENAGALDRQERDVLAATDALRREREKLAREADVAARRLKEVGNVQNWAEVLERGFLVLEETVRRVNTRRDSGGDGSGSSSGSGSGSECSCSDCGRTLGGEVAGEEMDVDGDGDGEENRVEGKGKGKEVVTIGLEAMSETSRSLFDGESSTTNDTGRAKSSETASLSTTC